MQMTHPPTLRRLGDIKTRFEHYVAGPVSDFTGGMFGILNDSSNMDRNSAIRLI